MGQNFSHGFGMALRGLMLKDVQEKNGGRGWFHELEKIMLTDLAIVETRAWDVKDFKHKFFEGLNEII